MLEYNENTQNSKILALYYANRVGGDLLVEFMGGRVDLSSKEQAASVVDGFWQMTDLAINDNHEGKQVEGITDIEFWMHKLFNKVNGYMTKNGFKDVWDKAMEER